MNALPTVTAATLAAAAVAAVTATPANIINGTLANGLCYLKPGLWEVSGAAVFVAAAGTTVTAVAAGINTASATLPTTDNGLVSLQGTLTTAGTQVLVLPPFFFRSPAGGTNLNLVGQASFATSTLGMSGYINAHILSD